MKKIYVIFLILLISSCGRGVPQKYVFDRGDTENNFSNSDDQFSGLMCAVQSLFFTKEVVIGMHDEDDIRIKDFDINKDNPTPASIALYADKIVWTDSGAESKITDNEIHIRAADDSVLKFRVVINENNLILESNPDGLICSFPFKKTD